MRKVVIVAPSLLGATEENSVLRQSLPSLDRLSEEGKLMRLEPMRSVETPEAQFLGMRPDEAQMRQGPLTISALGADPPERSTHLHLSLLGVDDGVVGVSEVAPMPEELRTILELLPKLNTKMLTFVEGEDRDHGLVWENLGDLNTYSPKEAGGKSIRTVLPEGDAENLLRRYIDDSINLLTELELNHRRRDEDLPPLNLLWPWGHGTRVRVQNLALRRGEPALVASESLRMEGLARLAGYRHLARRPLRKGINFDLGSLAKEALKAPTLLILVSTPAELRSRERMEELEWFVKRMDDELLTPLWEASHEEEMEISLLSPSPEHSGLALHFRTGRRTNNIYPFDERALEERTVENGEVWAAIDKALSS